MATRKHLSERTLRASLLVQLGLIPYEDAKKMTVDQVISLFHVDHNILHETGHPDRDAFWNLTHRLIKEHREKTKLDAKIIAKSRRIRAWNQPEYKDIADWQERGPFMTKRKLRSRGFDKRYRKKMDGTVEKR